MKFILAGRAEIVRNTTTANMCRIVLLLGILNLMGVGTVAGIQKAGSQPSPQALFDTANTYFNKGNYREALQRYHQILEQAESGALYLNMGISYVRLDSLGKAKYYFLKAREYPVAQSRAEEALNYVNQRFSRQSAVLPPLPWQQYFEWLEETAGYRALIKFGFLLLNLGILLVLVYWNWKRVASRRWFKYLSLTVVGIGLLGLAHGAYLSYLGNRYHKAVMIQQQQQVYEQPNTESGVVSMSYEGYTFRVDLSRGAETNGWHYVRLSNGLYGWIPAEDILIL